MVYYEEQGTANCIWYVQVTIEIPIEVIHGIGKLKLGYDNYSGVLCNYVLCKDCPINPLSNKNIEICDHIYEQAIPQLLIHYPELLI